MYINFNEKIYNLRAEIIGEITRLFEQSEEKTFLLDNVYNMACDADYIDVTIKTIKYDGFEFTLTDDEGYEYGISNISSVDELANLYNALHYQITKK